MKFTPFASLLVLSIALGGCPDSSDPGTEDVGVDVRPGIDAGDVGFDIAQDTTEEVGEDVAEDTTEEVGEDVSVDAPSDTAEDVSEDAPTDATDAGEDAPMDVIEDTTDAGEDAPMDVVEDTTDAGEDAPMDVVEDTTDAGEDVIEDTTDAGEDVVEDTTDTGDDVTPVEICDNEEDDDGDDDIDCADDDCADDPACVIPVLTDMEDLAPCDAGDGTSPIDSWILTIGEGGGSVAVDTISVGTTFDPTMAVLDGVGAYFTAAAALGDDEFGCAFPPAEYSCPSVDLPAGTYEVVVGVGAFSDCADGAIGDYEIRVTNGTALDLELDDASEYLAETEVLCDDGFDDDLDELVDCADDDCSADPACVTEASFDGTFDSCPEDFAIADTYVIEIPEGVTATLTVDTVADDTAFDPSLIQLVAVGDYANLEDVTAIGDDDFGCTFAPAAWSCPEGTLEAGTYEVAVFNLGSCNGDSGAYTLTVDGASSVTAVLDDVTLPIDEPAGEVTCDDGESNDGDFFFDCDDPDCFYTEACPIAGTFTPCGNDRAFFDGYEIEVGVAGATLRVDTVADATAFDPVLIEFETPGDYSTDYLWDEIVIGDDDLDCSFPPPSFSCPEATLDEGLHEVALVANTLASPCADAELGEYLFYVTGDVLSVTPTVDDFENPFEDPEVSCDDSVDNDLDGLFDCDDSDCVTSDACSLGSLGVCSSVEDWFDGNVDTWLVTVGAEGGTFAVDTVAAETTFDPQLRVLEAPGAYDLGLDALTIVGDDEFECTFQPTTWSCPEAALTEGVYELVVVNASPDVCAADTAEYRVSATGAVTFERVLDDVVLPIVD